MRRETDWRARGLCASLTPTESDKIFFIGPGQTKSKANAFCKPCPVFRECKAFAIVHNEKGIWAGETEVDREEIDPFVKGYLKDQAKANGTLESRNLNDFIDQVRDQHKTAIQQSQYLHERSAAAITAAELEVLRSELLQEEAEELLEALVHPFDMTTDQPES